MTPAHESLIRSYLTSFPEGAAHALERLDAEEAAGVLETLTPAEAGPVVERLTPHAAGAILGHFGPQRTQELLEGMAPRQAVVVMRLLEDARREAVLSGLPDDAARKLRALLRYPPESAGGIMDPQVVSLPVDLTVREAIDALRRAPRQALYYLYVTGRDGVLHGVLNLRDLLLAGPTEPIRGYVKPNVVSVPVDMDREDVAGVMRSRGFIALPVVDEAGRLLGIVKHDEVLETVQEEAFEDLQRMVGAGGDESALSPVGTVVRRRLPWLMVNLVTAFMAAAVVGMFEGIIAQVTVLAVLLPVVSGQGGNSGAQALAVVMRGLALRELRPGHGWRVILKELLAGLTNGVAVAAVTAAAVGAWTRSPGLALVIGLAMIVNMAAAAIAGAVIPMTLQRLGRDPAQASSIFLTTVTDIVGFASFLGFAVIFAPLLV